MQKNQYTVLWALWMLPLFGMSASDAADHEIAFVRYFPKSNQSKGGYAGIPKGKDVKPKDALIKFLQSIEEWKSLQLASRGKWTWIKWSKDRNKSLEGFNEDKIKGAFYPLQDLETYFQNDTANDNITLLHSVNYEYSVLKTAFEECKKKIEPKDQPISKKEPTKKEKPKAKLPSNIESKKHDVRKHDGAVKDFLMFKSHTILPLGILLGILIYALKLKKNDPSQKPKMKIPKKQQKATSSEKSAKRKNKNRPKSKKVQKGGV